MTTDRSADRRPRPGRPGRPRNLRWAGLLAGVFALGVALGGLGTWTLGLVGGDQAPRTAESRVETGGGPPAPDAPASAERGAIRDVPAGTADDAPTDTAPAAGTAEPAAPPAETSVPVTVRVSEMARRAYRAKAAPGGQGATPADAPEAGMALDGAPDGAPDGMPPPTDETAAGSVAVGRALRLAAAPRADTPPAPETPDASGVAPELAVPPRPATAPALTPGDGPPAWLARAVPADIAPETPIVAVVIDDLGVDVARSRRALDLPGPLTMSFLPYGYDLPAMVETARANGHEILVHLPMEPESADIDPGPHALMTGLDRAELAKRLAWNLGRFEHFVGLNNHMGSRFSADAAGMRQVMEVVRERGLLFLDSLTTRATKGREIAAAMGVPHAVRDVFIDHRRDPAFIRDQLARTIEVARAQGHAVAIGHPHAKTIAVLRDWLPTLAGRGVRLAPISAVVKRRTEGG